jgi:hypothetical protein
MTPEEAFGQLLALKKSWRVMEAARWTSMEQ